MMRIAAKLVAFMALCDQTRTSLMEGLDPSAASATDAAE